MVVLPSETVYILDANLNDLISINKYGNVTMIPLWGSAISLALSGVGAYKENIFLGSLAGYVYKMTPHCASPYAPDSGSCVMACNGTAFSDLSVCSGHGDCVDFDSCSCHAGYVGSNCEYAECYGLYANDSMVCSGKGNCSNPDTCTCNNGYIGSNCDYAECYGLFANDSMVCSGKGNCTNINTCTCKNGYTGVKCELTALSCFGLLATDGNVCSGHGQCSATDTCLCHHRSGPNCQYNTCFLKSEVNPLVCSGNGQCIDFNTCACNSTYYGSECSHQFKTCFGKNGTDLNVCSGHGTCHTKDSCVCNHDSTLGFWSGNECQSCDSGYGSSDCTQPIITSPTIATSQSISQSISTSPSSNQHNANLESIQVNGNTNSQQDLLFLLFLLFIPVIVVVIVVVVVIIFIVKCKNKPIPTNEQAASVVMNELVGI